MKYQSLFSGGKKIRKILSFCRLLNLSIQKGYVDLKSLFYFIIYLFIYLNNV